MAPGCAGQAWQADPSSGNTHCLDDRASRNKITCRGLVGESTPESRGAGLTML